MYVAIRGDLSSILKEGLLRIRGDLGSGKRSGEESGEILGGKITFLLTLGPKTGFLAILWLEVWGKIRVKITAASRWWAESGEILSSEGENNPGDLQIASTPPHTGLSGVLSRPWRRSDVAE